MKTRRIPAGQARVTDQRGWQASAPAAMQARGQMPPISHGEVRGAGQQPLFIPTSPTAGRYDIPRQLMPRPVGPPGFRNAVAQDNHPRDTNAIFLEAIANYLKLMQHRGAGRFAPVSPRSVAQR